MATKQEWEEYIKALQVYIKALKKWAKNLPDGEVVAQGGIETPPPPPPNP